MNLGSIVTRLVRVVVVSSVEVLVQELHKTRVPSFERNKTLDILNHIERVRPHISFSPSLVFTRPCTRRVACFHEARAVVEDGLVRAE